MSAPGAGKTTLLERGAAAASTASASGVLEGDVQGSMDADRIAALHIPVTQLNTENGFGGECHLDANMVRSAIADLPLDEIDLLVIENVGNLVCPAEFRVGEDARVMVCSVTEGEDKPLKYPLMFRACELVVVNKIDLLAAPRLRPRPVARQPRRGQSRRRADAREREDGRGRRRVGRVARRGAATRAAAAPRRGERDAASDALAGRVDELLAARHRGQPAPSSSARRSRSRAAATGWPSASPAAAAWSRWGARRRRAPTPGTSRSSSSTR